MKLLFNATITFTRIYFCWALFYILIIFMTYYGHFWQDNMSVVLKLSNVPLLPICNGVCHKRQNPLLLNWNECSFHRWLYQYATCWYRYSHHYICLFTTTQPSFTLTSWQEQCITNVRAVGITSSWQSAPFSCTCHSILSLSLSMFSAPLSLG